jgi:long-chain acyl-CoA synthetase
VANLADHLFRQARERGGKRALVFEGQEFTFEQLAARVRRQAGGLAKAGVKTGTRCGLMLNTSPDFIVFQQALFALGAVVCPLNTSYRERELAHVIDSCALEFLIIDGEYLSVLPDVCAPAIATLRRVFVVGRDASLDTEILRSTECLAISGALLDVPVSLASTAIGIMLNTSATTGKAKGVMLSVGNIQANYDSTPDWLGLTESAVTLCALPLFNTFGLNQGINALMRTGATMVLLPKFDAALCVAAIEAYRCTFFPAVPTMLQKILDFAEAGRHDLRSIERILTGGAPVPAALLARIRAALGAKVVVMTGYGLTEGTALVSLEQIETDAAGNILRPKSIGRVLPGMEMRILNDNRAPARSKEVGEICIRGPNVMQGYFREPEQTAQAIIDGWLHTGDMGYVDADGFAYIVDRKKDVIIRGGQNIYPADIEEVLYDHPAVSEVAVVGEPDAMFGEVPVAYVALRPQGKATAEELTACCRAQLANSRVPKAIHFLPVLPKGPTGKILRRALRVAINSDAPPVATSIST